jgi:cysteine desulfurase / selenocysteine lyase
MKPAQKLSSDSFRDDFPILHREIRGKPLIYLDNAATSQKPESVIETIHRYYLEENSNIHRGVHFLSEQATTRFEKVRCQVAGFINACESREIIFVRGTTEGINLVVQTYGRANFKKGDEIVVTEMEHHSNIVPWQMLCEEKGLKLKVAPINDAGELLMDKLEELLTEKTKLVAVTYVSNALGTINPIKDIIAMAHRKDIRVLVDGAQAVPHLKVDVQDLDCDFFVFSGHKMYGPTGIGALYGKEALLEKMPPYHGGGDMIRKVSFEKTEYSDLPYKFEAGTPNIGDVMGLGAAIDYIHSIGLVKIAAHEDSLLKYATEAVASIPGIKIIGTARNKASVLSFVMEGVHPHDIGTIVDQEGVAIRVGHHCAMPLMKRLGVPATARASFAIYNTRSDVDALVASLKKVKKLFGH